MTKKNLMPSIVLGAICLVVALLLAVVNMITAPIIAAKAEERIQNSLKEVMPGASGFDETEVNGAPKTVRRVYIERGGMGYVVILETSTDYTGTDPMSITVGISSDGKITGVKITAYTESKDMGKKTYPQKFVGLGENELAGVNTVTGVTYSSSAFKDAIADAFVAASLATPEDPYTALVREFTGVATPVLIDEITNTAPVDKIWRIGGDGYVVLTSTKNDYDPTVTDTELLVWVGEDGKVKDFKILTWVHGEGTTFTPEFEDAFVGKDTEGVDGIDVITGSTGTSNKVKTSVKAAIEAAGGALLKLVTAFGGAAEEISVSGAWDSVKKVWITDGGIAVLTATKHDYAPTVTDTEILVLVGSDGRVSKIKILAWVHGENTGFTPTFEDAFIGKDTAGTDGVDVITGSTGTSGKVKTSVKAAIAAALLADPYPAKVQALTGSATPVEIFDIPFSAPVKRMWRIGGSGFVVLTSTKHDYAPTVTDTEILVYVGDDGKVIDIEILAWVHGEGTTFTPEFESAFNGKDAVGVDGVDVITGSTGTSNKVKTSVKAAIETANSALTALIESFDGEAVEVYLPELPTTVKRVFKTANGVVVMTATKHDYAPTVTDTELLVYVSDNGKTEDIIILAWVHGEGTGFTPDFESAFAGKDTVGVDGVDVITGSTGTSNKVKASVKTAMEVAESAECESARALCEELAGEDVSVVYSDVENRVKFVFKTSDGYIAYTATKHDYSPTLTDTALLVWVDNDGKVKEIKILTWVHGEGTTFTPEFEDTFAGKDTAGVDGVDTITGSTGTSNKVKASVKDALAKIQEIKEGE